MQRMVGKELDLPQEVWKRLTWFWGLGFVAIANKFSLAANAKRT
jgi:intracellular septation protein A